MGLAKIITLTGATASGKSTVARELMQIYACPIITSSTTRSPRADALPGEYEFLTQDQFALIVEQEGFAWQVEFAGHRYGTQAAYIQEALQAEGVPSLMVLVPSAVRSLYNFIEAEGQDPTKLVLPFCFETPSREMIVDRMLGRGDSADDTASRLKSVKRFEGERISSGIDYILVSGLGDVEVPVERIASYF